MTLCYIGLGSNLNNPRRQLILSIRALKSLPRTTVKKKSKVYITEPWGVAAQPVFYNMVVAIETTLNPIQLLAGLHDIEQTQLRIRKRHWGPRTLDLDILLYGSRTIKTHDLTIPHPYLLERDFVLEPLLEIAPEVFSCGSIEKYTTL